MTDQILDHRIFEAAAHKIEQIGWWRSINNGQDPMGGTCIANAVNRALTDSGVHEWDDTRCAYGEFLSDHLKLAPSWGEISWSALFSLNDNQPDYETGKAWAIASLKDAASALWRKNNQVAV